MNSKLLSQPTLDTIDEYLHFKMGQAECSVPYFNNKRRAQRAGLRATIGKGSPKEILDEVEILGMREKIKAETWTSESLKRFMCDNDIGIDCSGLAYYILAAESKVRGAGALERHLAFKKGGFLRRLTAKWRPVENCDVLVFADPTNSAMIDLAKIEPGDFITMTGAESERNHIVVVTAVEHNGSAPTIITYTHSIAWPDDGEYGHGVRQGVIEVIDPTKGLVDQKWIEKEKTGVENPTYLRAKISMTELRRLRWWK